MNAFIIIPKTNKAVRRNMHLKLKVHLKLVIKQNLVQALHLLHLELFMFCFSCEVGDDQSNKHREAKYLILLMHDYFHLVHLQNGNFIFLCITIHGGNRPLSAGFSILFNKRINTNRRNIIWYFSKHFIALSRCL